MKKQSLWQILFEFLSIVFAVLLALGLNSYKQNLDLEKESKVLSIKIIKECVRNLEKLDSVIIQNKEFEVYLDSVLAADKIEGFSFNFSNDLLPSSAWKFTQASRSFQLMDQEFLDNATELYEIQNYYMTIANQMFQNLGEMLMQIDSVEPRTLVVTSHYYLRNILDAADGLKTTYEEFLAKYEYLTQES